MNKAQWKDMKKSYKKENWKAARKLIKRLIVKQRKAEQND